MNLDEAIKKHGEWKLKFHHAIANHETLDALAISRDNSCELGKWLHGEAKAAYQQLPNFAQCVKDHAAFHVEAGKIASIINAKNYTEAESLMGFGKPFSTASFAVGGSIFGLKNATRK